MIGVGKIVEKIEEQERRVKEQMDKMSLREINALEPMVQRICPKCDKDCMVVLYGTPVFLGRKRKKWYKTVCARCGTEWYLDNHDSFTKEELQQKYITYF